MTLPCKEWLWKRTLSMVRCILLVTATLSEVKYTNPYIYERVRAGSGECVARVGCLSLPTYDIQMLCLCTSWFMGNRIHPQLRTALARGTSSKFIEYLSSSEMACSLYSRLLLIVRIKCWFTQCNSDLMNFVSYIYWLQCRLSKSKLYESESYVISQPFYM